MIARYMQDDQGITFHTESPINSDEKTYREFLSKLENLEGIEGSAAGRYYFDCVFGLLFDADVVSRKVIELFKNTFNVIAVDPMDAADLLRIKGIQAPLIPNMGFGGHTGQA